MWAEEQKQTIEAIKKSGKKITLIGDGRNDSPGHSAKYGTYTMMESDSGKILDTDVVAVTEVIE